MPGIPIVIIRMRVIIRRRRSQRRHIPELLPVRCLILMRRRTPGRKEYQPQQKNGRAELMHSRMGHVELFTLGTVENFDKAVTSFINREPSKQLIQLRLFNDEFGKPACVQECDLRPIRSPRTGSTRLRTTPCPCNRLKVCRKIFSTACVRSMAGSLIGITGNKKI